MSIARYYQNFAAVCDYCDKQLPGEFTYDAAVRAKRAAGWDRRKVDGEWVDICTQYSRCAEVFERAKRTDIRRLLLPAMRLAAVVGLIYAQFCQTGTSTGADFRDALTAMTREDAAIWTAADTTIKGGYGRCIVYAAQEKEESE